MDSTVTQEFVPHAQDLSGLSGSIGAAWNLNDRLTLKANLGRGYRAPSAAETTAQGVHAGAGLMQLGMRNSNPNSTSRKIWASSTTGPTLLPVWKCSTTASVTTSITRSSLR